MVKIHHLGMTPQASPRPAPWHWALVHLACIDAPSWSEMHTRGSVHSFLEGSAVKATTIGAIAVSIAVTLSPAFALASQLTPEQLTWARALKACLERTKVPLEGGRPGCFLTPDLRLRCLDQYKKAGAACLKEAQPRAPAKRIPW